MDLTAAATLFLALLVGVQSQHSSGKRMLLQQLNLLAYRGDMEGVRTLFREHRSSLLEALSGEERTPVHYALQGRHESLSHQSTSLPGHHEEIVSFLIHTAGVGADQGCPLYYALHYRNMKVLETLLENADMERSLPCLTSLDSTGRTALHAAVRSKASGFARLFSKLRHKKPDPTVLELLGLRPLEVSDGDVLSARDLNSAITHTDLQLVLARWPSLDLTSIVDHSGNTLLHDAAYSGRQGLVEMLVERLDIHARNDLGLTPLHLAQAGHHQDIVDILTSHGAQDSPVDRDIRTAVAMGGGMEGVCLHSERQSCAVEEGGAGEEVVSVWWQKYLESGWIGSNGTSNLRESPTGCQIAIRSHLSPDEFESQYLGMYRPVVMRGMMEGWPAWDHWTKPALIERYGGLEFMVSGVPYASLYYGQEALTSHTTLRDFVHSFQQEQSQYPLYIFDGQILHHHPQLSRDAPLLPPSSSSLPVSLKQLIIGPRGSGSPPHFHGHALNALVYGLKRWFLWPPSHAHFVFRHVRDWYGGYSDGGARDGPVAVECVQRPGDVLYIPESWGHAVVNLQDSIGVAYEFG